MALDFRPDFDLHNFDLLGHRSSLKLILGLGYMLFSAQYTRRKSLQTERERESERERNKIISKTLFKF